MKKKDRPFFQLMYLLANYLQLVTHFIYAALISLLWKIH